MTSENKGEIWNIRFELLICFFLVSTTLYVYWPIRNFGFTIFDDNVYVYENKYVKNGLSLKNVLWSFSFEQKTDTHWHPLTWLSHMVDCQLYGLEPGMHHTTNLILHVLNGLFLFLALKRMTGALWQSAFVAFLFMLHPLNVNSVVWIAERKNVLSAFFWMLTIWLYARYCEQPKIIGYFLTLFVFAMGLMAKPMLVTLPFVLLLLDYWPLKRYEKYQNNFIPDNNILFCSWSKKASIQNQGILAYILEKIPFFLFSAATVYLSSSAIQENISQSTHVVPITLRIENALISYILYIKKMIWPKDLSVFYPYPNNVPTWQAISALIIIISITLLALKSVKRYPYLIIGWLWYLGTLTPMLGLIQAGLWPAMADRFAYIPFIGLFIIIAWSLPILFSWSPFNTTVIATLGITILSTQMVITRTHLFNWKDDISLFQHAVSVTDNNIMAYNNLGIALAKQGKTKEAIHYYNKALQIKHDDTGALNNMGLALIAESRQAEALKAFKKVITLNPRNPKAYNNIGITMANLGEYDRALIFFEKALKINPDFKDVHNNLGFVLATQGHLNKAIRHYYVALIIDPYFSKARNNLARALLKQGKIRESFYQYSETLRRDPLNQIAIKNLKILTNNHSQELKN